MTTTSNRSQELIAFLRGLRAVREYTPDPVPEEAVRDIVEVGRWTGTASNRQHAEVVVVRDKGVLQQIAEGGVRPAAGAALALVVVTAGNPDTRDLEVFDEGRLVERLLLAAKARGLGANIGTLKGDGPEAVKRALGIPAERRAWSVVTIGQIDREARKARPANPNAGRRPTEEFARWERY